MLTSDDRCTRRSSAALRVMTSMSVCGGMKGILPQDGGGDQIVVVTFRPRDIRQSCQPETGRRSYEDGRSAVDAPGRAAQAERPVSPSGCQSYPKDSQAPDHLVGCSAGAGDCCLLRVAR
ncbi:hypothetical protein GCM10009533_08210 [Saccharopolyspora spinosporotrichia]|uniref:Uncharacterized protein n=1 Tax=Saccharopolyspora erythraea TaxID=1836 RepID=A0ABN1C4Q6_SACER